MLDVRLLLSNPRVYDQEEVSTMDHAARQKSKRSVGFSASWAYGGPFCGSGSWRSRQNGSGCTAETIFDEDTEPYVLHIDHPDPFIALAMAAQEDPDAFGIMGQPWESDCVTTRGMTKWQEALLPLLVVRPDEQGYPAPGLEPTFFFHTDRDWLKTLGSELMRLSRRDALQDTLRRLADLYGGRSDLRLVDVVDKEPEALKPGWLVAHVEAAEQALAARYEALQSFLGQYQAFIDQALSQLPKPRNLAAGLSHQRKQSDVVAFCFDYYSERGVLPSGRHRIAGSPSIEIDFPRWNDQA
jgi:hypothetical protein